MLKFSRASLNYYRKHGLVTSGETNKEVVYEGMEIPTYFINTLAGNLEQLESTDKLSIANNLIAHCVDAIYKMLTFGETKNEQSRNELATFVSQAHSYDQQKVDLITIQYLDEEIIPRLKLKLGEKVWEQLDSMRSGLVTIEDGLIAQDDADSRFLQFFKHLLELVKAYRLHMFSGESI